MSENNSPSNAQIRALELYVDLHNRTACYHILQTARKIGLIEALGTGEKNLEQLSECCGVTTLRLRPIMDVLCELKIVEQYGEDYTRSQVTRLLTPHDNDLGQAYFETLTDSMNPRAEKSGNRLAAIRSRLMARQWLTTPVAIELTRVLQIGTDRTGLRVLDIGCGTGVFSLAIADRDPNPSITLVDDTEPLQTAKANAKAMGLLDCIHTIVGDYRTVGLPTAQFNLVLLANALSLESDGGHSLITRAQQALHSEGELVIVDLFPGQPQGDITRQVYSIEIGMQLPDAQPCAPFDIQDLLDSCGFNKPMYSHLEAPPYAYGMIVARKR